MRFQPKTDEEINQIGILEGIFDFEVRAAREYINDKGNEVFEIELNVYDHEGIARPRKDWVTPSYAKKFKHLHDSVGLLSKYESGETQADDLVGKSGKLKMSKRKYINKEGKEAEGDQIDDYIKRDRQPETVATGAIPLDDEVPF